MLPVLFVVALPGLTAVSRSEEPEDPRAQALRLTSEGAAAYKAEEYDQAIDKFNTAYRLYPAAPLLLDISRAELKLSRCAEAVHHAEKFKAAVGDTPAASPDSPDAWLATVQRACIEAEVDSEPAGATIWINGERQTSPDKTPWTGRLPVGSHKVLLWHAGYQERSGYLDVSADAPAHLTLMLTPVTTPVIVPAADTGVIPTMAPKAPLETSTPAVAKQRAAGWVAAPAPSTPAPPSEVQHAAEGPTAPSSTAAALH